LTAGSDTPAGAGNGDPSDRTSYHVRMAEAGDPDSLEWVVRRFSPVLLVQARFRLGSRLRRVVDPEDLVDEVWAIALRRLPELGSKAGRKTPVLLRFLTTTLLNRVNDLVKTEIKGPRGRRETARDTSATSDPLAAIPSGSKGIVSSILAHERDEALEAALAGLDPVDREVILLRAIEQNSGATVARLVDTTEKAVSMRYRRALDRLRAALPESIFDEVDDA
jgi:RNA polymerase sigma-70 factor, ECF subfamily